MPRQSNFAILMAKLQKFFNMTVDLEEKVRYAAFNRHKYRVFYPKKF